MIKIWNEAFLKKQPDNQENKIVLKLRWPDYVPLTILAAASVLMGVFAASVFSYTMEAANQLIEPSHYINAVLSNKMP